MKSNLVHTYVEGNKFPNIFGSDTDCLYGQIIHIEHMNRNMELRWPWMKNMWELSDPRGNIGYFKTLTEAKKAAKVRWPNCWFKTREQYAKEID